MSSPEVKGTNPPHWTLGTARTTQKQTTAPAQPPPVIRLIAIHHVLEVETLCDEYHELI
jgi:hypothetical protein